jgi:hypothetical protein
VPTRQWPQCPGELPAGPDTETPRGRPVGRTVTGLLQHHSQLSKTPMPDTIIFDVDDTLVDSNYQHALAWYRALRRYDITVPL